LIPAVLSIDVEPDGYFLDRSAPPSWRGFELSVEYFRAFRDRASRTLGRPVRVNWFVRMDPQIADTYGSPAWVAEQYPRQLAELAAAGDEVGLHVHAYRWSEDQGEWIVDHGNQGWIDHCIDTSVDAFRTAFGAPARLFRFGDHWMNEQTAARLEAAGIRYELTMEPGHAAVASNHPDKPHSGSLPDTRHAPRAPYQPQPSDVQQPGPARARGMWLIPVTTAAVRPRWSRRAYYRLFRPDRLTRSWAGLISHESVLFDRILQAAIDDPSCPHLSLVMRTQAMTRPAVVRRVDRNLALVMRRLGAAPYLWTTPAALVEEVERARAASPATATARV
jgi:hypothetical protein